MLLCSRVDVPLYLAIRVPGRSVPNTPKPSLKISPFVAEQGARVVTFIVQIEIKN